MKSQAQTGTIKIWFGLLKLAIAQGLPINEQVYAAWGTRDELTKTRFNRWWRERGKELFQDATPKVELVEATENCLTVKIPRSMTAVEVKRQISHLVTRVRGAKRIRRRATLAFVGDVKYRTLKQYERLLEVEFDPRNAGKTIEEKTELLRDVYRRIKVRLDKQKATLQQSKKRDRTGRLMSAKFRSRDPDSFGSAAEIRRGVDPKKVSRWRLSGKILLLNVAEGAFPGRDYYGSQLAQKLRRRLGKIGMEDIGAAKRSKGGGRNTEELTRVRSRRTKAKSRALSLQAYGSGKDSNPVGSVEE
jgi:hypothetical protein